MSLKTKAFVAIRFSSSILSKPLSPSPCRIELHPSHHCHLRSESSLSLITFYCLNSLVSLISQWVHCKVCDFSYLVNHCCIDWFRISNLCLWVPFIYFFSTKNTIGLIWWLFKLCFWMQFWSPNLGSIPTCIENWLVSWSNNNELSLEADAVDWNSQKKKKIVLVNRIDEDDSLVDKDFPLFSKPPNALNQPHNK